MFLLIIVEHVDGTHHPMRLLDVVSQNCYITFSGKYSRMTFPRAPAAMHVTAERAIISLRGTFLLQRVPNLPRPCLCLVYSRIGLLDRASALGLTKAFLDFDGSDEAWRRYDKITARQASQYHHRL